MPAPKPPMPAPKPPSPAPLLPARLPLPRSKSCTARNRLQGWFQLFLEGRTHVPRAADTRQLDVTAVAALIEDYAAGFECWVVMIATLVAFGQIGDDGSFQRSDTPEVDIRRLRRPDWFSLGSSRCR